MNYQVCVLRGVDISAGPGGARPSAFVQVLQTTHADIQVGCTKAVPETGAPCWDALFLVHGIRGLKFRFVVYDWRAGDYAAIGAASWDAARHRVGEDAWVSLKSSSQRRCGAILVRVSETDCRRPVVAPNAGKPLPPDLVIYASLAFAPPAALDRGPADLALVAFGASGCVTELAFSASPAVGRACAHSGAVPCRSYDTPGPSVRIDLQALFGRRDPAHAVVVVVTSNEMSVPLSWFEWIAVDFYATGEAMSRRTCEGFLNLADEMFSLPKFHSRVAVTAIP